VSENSSLDRAISWLNGQKTAASGPGELALHLQSLATMFRRMHVQEHREHIARFHNAAGVIPFFQDTDIGALVLEQAADDASDATLKSFLYTEALYRAQWCAQAASAGGEGLARSRHVEQLQAKLANAA